MRESEINIRHNNLYSYKVMEKCVKALSEEDC